MKQAQDEVKRAESNHQIAHLSYERLAGVAKTRVGLVAQQEVDDAQARIWPRRLKSRLRNRVLRRPFNRSMSRRQSQGLSNDVRLYESHGTFLGCDHKALCEHRIP